MKQINRTTNGQKYDSQHNANTIIYLALESSYKTYVLTEPLSSQSLNVAFTSLTKLEKFMKNLYGIGFVHSKEYRAFPTTFDEYFNSLKAKFGNLDLIIDPPEDFKASDSTLFIQGEITGTC